jgi:hypothetical protein
MRYRHRFDASLSPALCRAAWCAHVGLVSGVVACQPAPEIGVRRFVPTLNKVDSMCMKLQLARVMGLPDATLTSPSACMDPAWSLPSSSLGKTCIDTRGRLDCPAARTTQCAPPGLLLPAPSVFLFVTLFSHSTALSTLASEQRRRRPQIANIFALFALVSSMLTQP